MRHLKATTQWVGLAAIGAAGLIALPTTAQTVPADLATRARESCLSQARTKGYELREVTSTEALADGGVKVVLDLVREGATARLTCTLSKEGAVSFGDTAPAATTATTATAPETTSVAAEPPVQTYNPTLPPWLGLLLPLVGLVPLLLWAKGRDADTYERVAQTATTVRDRAEAVVRTDGGLLDIHSGPGETYRVTGNLRAGQRVVLSGRQDDNWVELSEGGWVPVRNLDLTARYTR